MQHWGINSESDFASWDCLLPALNENEKLEWALEFISQFIQIGRSERVWNVLETKAVVDFQGFNAAYGDYTTYVRDLAAATGRIHLFPDRSIGTDERGTLRTPGTISYFDKRNQLVERSVDNMAEILIEVRETEDFLSKYTAPVPPVLVHGTIIYLESSLEYKRYPDLMDYYREDLSITLHTDIWFPKVCDFNLWRPSLIPGVCQYDNVLAQYHTPRLNNFLEQVQRLLVAMGGGWKYDGSTGYDVMVGEHHILLGG